MQLNYDVLFMTLCIVLFREVRSYVLEMRLQSLNHLVRYTQSSVQCRGVELLGALTGDASIPDDMKCGFCDVCRDDLSFERRLAEPMPESGQLDDILAAIEDSFQKEDIERLDWALEECQIRKITASLGQQAVARLEFDPDNPAANLAAAESYSRSPDPNLRRSAYGFFREFAQTANVERKDVQLAQRGYSGYRRFDPTESIRDYAREGSAFDTPELMSMLDKDGDKSNLTEEERYSLKTVHYAERYGEILNAFSKDPDLLSALSEW